MKGSCASSCGTTTSCPLRRCARAISTARTRERFFDSSRASHWPFEHRSPSMSRRRARGRSATRRAARVVLPMAGGPFKRTSLTMVRCCRAEGRPAALVGNRFESVPPADQLLLPGFTHSPAAARPCSPTRRSFRHSARRGLSERRGDGPVGRVLYGRGSGADVGLAGNGAYRSRPPAAASRMVRSQPSGSLTSSRSGPQPLAYADDRRSRRQPSPPGRGPPNRRRLETPSWPDRLKPREGTHRGGWRENAIVLCAPPFPKGETRVPPRRRRFDASTRRCGLPS